jgi:DUF438 domain-containing protein
MQNTTRMESKEITDARELIKQAAEKQEIEYGTREARLRIDLRTEDIQLWKFHQKSYSDEGNILLACEDNSGSLSETRLTWVVGAAIRSTMVEGSDQAKDLLKKLGVAEELVNLASEHCPGLGGTAVWAFHLERHGWLTATPIES